MCTHSIFSWEGVNIIVAKYKDQVIIRLPYISVKQAVLCIENFSDDYNTLSKDKIDTITMYNLRHQNNLS